MSNTPFSKRRIRLGCNVRSTEEARDVRDRSTLRAYDRADLRVEVALFDGDPANTATPFVSLDNITELRFVIVDDTLESAALVESVVESASFTRPALNRTEWDDDDPEHAHVVFEIDYTEMALLSTGEKTKTYHFAIYGPAGGGQDIYGHGKLTIVRSGAPINASQYVGTASRLDNARPYLLASDGNWYGLTVVTNDGVRQLAVDPNSGTAATTVTEAAVGPTWGFNDGQLHWYDGVTDWWPIVRVFNDGVMQVQVGVTALGTTPNGVLVGSIYSAKTGRVRARDENLDHHWLVLLEQDGVMQVQWSDTTVAG